MLNEFKGIGRLTADPEIRYTNSGTAVASYTVACDYGYGDNKKTEFVRCVSWSKLAEICGEYLRKGSLVYICGAMETRKWQDNNGENRYTTEINVREMKMLGGKSDNTGGGYNEPPNHSTGDDLPF